MELYERCMEIVAYIGNDLTDAHTFDVARAMYNAISERRPATHKDVSELVYSYMPPAYGAVSLYNVVTVERFVLTVVDAIDVEMAD